MKTFAYVICELVDGRPSFRHAFVEAETEEGAYAAGHREVRQPRGEGINDYVCEMPAARRQARKVRSARKSTCEDAPWCGCCGPNSDDMW